MLAKYWLPGQVKTRLACDVGDQAAALIHRQFTIHLAGQLSLAADFRYVFVSPDQECSKMQAAVGESWVAVPQGNGDLGMRMSRAFKHMFASGKTSAPSQVVLIGADLPTITSVDLDLAFAELDENEVVLGPAADGGYYLIGLRGPWRSDFQRLFDAMPWSTSDLLFRTKQVIDDLGFRCGYLGIREDIDTVDCLHRLLRSDETDQALRASIRALLDPAIPSPAMNPSQPL